MRHRIGPWRGWLAAAIVLTLLMGASPAIAVPLSALPDLSALTSFAAFGNVYNDSNVTINGDVGISAGGKLTLMAPSTIDGDLYLATGATSSGSGIVTGTTFYGQNLTAAQNQVFSASSTLAGLSPNQVLGNVNVPAAGMTFGSANGIADVTVIDMISLTTGGGNITFAGDPGDYFVLNISSGLSMTGSAAIGDSGLAGHVLVNLYDPSGKSLGTVAHVDNIIYGTTLIPYDSATFHSINGAIYSGLKQITLMSDATVEHTPIVSPVPEPSTLLLLGTGLAGLAFLRWRRDR